MGDLKPKVHTFDDREKARLAGAKSKRGPALVRKTVQELADPEKSMKAFRLLEDTALNPAAEKHWECLRLYLGYVFGMPTVTIDQKNTGEIIVIRDGNTYPPIRAASGAGDDITEAETV